MLKEFGLILMFALLLSNVALAIAMQISARWGEYPSVVRLHGESSVPTEVKAHWVAGNALCNPRIALCH